MECGQQPQILSLSDPGDKVAQTFNSEFCFTCPRIPQNID